jgi:hypothetical protein
MAKAAINPVFKPDEHGNVNELVKFEREGKSVNPDGTKTAEHCKTCGAELCIDKFSVLTECKYCVGQGTASNQKRQAHSKNKRMTLGKIFMIISALSFVMSVFFSLVLTPLIWDYFGEYMHYFHITAIVSLVVFISSLLMWFNAMPITQARAYVKNLNKPSIELDFGGIDFETQQGELMTLDVSLEKYNLISQGDVGILHYKLGDKGQKSFVKFDNDGKSAAFNETTAKKCKNCGGAIHVEEYRFFTQIICKYCNSVN